MRTGVFPTGSNDLMSVIGLVDVLTFTEMSVTEDDCEGVYSDWLGPDDSSTTTSTSTIVEFDYHIFIEKGSSLSSALTIFQNRLLRHMGSDVFLVCASQRLADAGINLATERQLDGTVIEEISTAPSDTVSISSSCKTEDADNEMS
mmetsp:Transcript_33902/g.64533  ORF Transcript_33902/g.64533 Transcript_33902/m.64533 type:complete len:146 (-) Transcript_33902:271-708(-)